MDKVLVVNLKSFSFTGTTYINTVLGSKPEAFALGPPDRFFDLRSSGKLCKVHGEDCPFWTGFLDSFREDENFFLQLAEYANKKILVINNPIPARAGKLLDDPRLLVKQIHIYRDGRAVSASHFRKHREKGVNSYREAVDSWYFPAASRHSFEQALKELVVRYEDFMATPMQELKRISSYLGEEFTEQCLKYWEADIHPIAGNQGMFSMIKMHQGITVGNFSGDEFYKSQFGLHGDSKLTGFKDERWRSELTAKDLSYFEKKCGRFNRQMGYSAEQHTGFLNSLSRLVKNRFLSN